VRGRLFFLLRTFSSPSASLPLSSLRGFSQSRDRLMLFFFSFPVDAVFLDPRTDLSGEVFSSFFQRRRNFFFCDNASFFFFFRSGAVFSLVLRMGRPPDQLGIPFPLFSVEMATPFFNFIFPVHARSFFSFPMRGEVGSQGFSFLVNVARDLFCFLREEVEGRLPDMLNFFFF